MSAAAPWSVKGIDPKAREVAKDLARRSGMTLGEWLNRVILEDDLPDEVANQADFAERPRLRIAPAPAVPTPPDLARVAFALDRLTDRIEASETRTGLAINGVEHSVRQALARIETGEREQLAVAARLEGALNDSTSEQGRLVERMRRLETEAVGPRSIEALRVMESRLSRAEPDSVVERVLQRLGERLATAEQHTATALDELGRSLGALDARVGAAERGGPDELRFEALAQVLTHRVEAVRAEIAEKLQATAGGAVEARLAEMAEHIRTAEQRSAQAVEDLGRQVLTMAEAVGRKLTDVDQRSADAIDQVGTEVARIAGAVEQRLARSEHAQAEAFERLGVELSRVTETLAERLSLSETRATEALDGVGEQVARVTERVAQRFAPEPQAYAAPLQAAAPDPLDEIYQRLGPPPEPEPEPEQAFAAPEPPTAAFGDELLSRAEPESSVEGLDTDWRRARMDPEPVVETVDAAWRRLDLEVPETEIPKSFAPLPEDDDDLFESAPRTPESPQLSTREVIDRARAAARAQQGAKPTEVRAKVDPRATSGRLFQGFGRPARQRPSTAMQTALMVAGGAAFLSVGAAGLTLMQGPVGPAPQEQAELSPFGPNPRAAVALSPASLNSTAAVDAFQAPVASPVFAKVRADVEAGRPGALTSLKALADAGHAQAQLYLGQLYDDGQAGLTANLPEARRLYTLAAEAGEPKAMHNLAVFYFRGEGGPQDQASAAQWFRKAAAAGVVESQFNLGRLYQYGSGVRADLAQARHWYEAAAAGGDAEARAALTALQPTGRPQAHRAAPRPHASAPARRASVASTGSANVRQAQAILGRLGYYDGPADGHATEAYRVALFRYQQDQRDQVAGPRPYTPQN